MRNRFATRLAALACGLAFSSLSAVAAADVESTERTNDGDKYIFRDDPLNADVGLPHGDNIRIRPTPYKLMLLRPRAHFIPEMLKSVERI
jgi:hypothetical protein